MSMAAAGTLFNQYANIIGLEKIVQSNMRSSARLLMNADMISDDYTLMSEAPKWRGEWKAPLHKRWKAASLRFAINEGPYLNPVR